jgi:uracil-DNA glycosylase family 4
MAWKPRREVPLCFACGKRKVDVKGFDDYKRSDEPLCIVCKELENPFEKPDECRVCTLWRRPGPVFHRGRPDKELMYVGEAPGEDEARYRKPFIGGSGKVFDRICHLAGDESNAHHVTNCVKCRPEHNRRPTDGEIRACSRYIISEIETINPNIIVALGDTALYVLTGKTGITKHRGVPLEGFGGRKILATLHPAYVMRDQSKYCLPIFDIQRALTESKFPELRRVPVVYVTDARPDVHGATILDRCRRSGVVVFDLETTNLDPRTSHVICNGLSDGTPGHAECYRWSPEVQQITAALFADPTIEVVGQNNESFDIPFLSVKGVPEPIGKVFDTMIGQFLVNADLPKDLGTLGANYTDMEHWKDKSKEDLFLYNCKDIDGTARAYHEIQKELKQLDMVDLYYKHMMPLQPILRRMSERGFKKDMELAAKWIVALERKALRLEEQLRSGLGEPNLNVNSPKEMMKLLYTTLGLPMQYKRTKDGYRPTADADALEALVEKFPDMVILRMVSEIRTIRTKYIATYLASETDERHFVHPRFGAAKAANGRLNSWDPNGQNIPFELREIYVPDTDEHVWIEADWGQVEWRDAMILAGDENGMKAMTSGYDVFKAAAATTFGSRIEDVSDEVRHSQKFIIYGLGYGRSDQSIAQAQNKSVEWATAFVKRYLDSFPQYRDWRQAEIKHVEENFFLANPWKRRRWWYTRMITEAYNFGPSSTAADMMIETLPKIEYQLPKGASLRSSVHDAVSVIAHRDVAKLAFECVRDNMQSTFPKINESCRNPAALKKYFPNGWYCPADIHIGLNWAQAKKGNKELEKAILG